MENTKTTTKKASIKTDRTDKKQAIVKAYMEYVLTEGRPPASVFLFTKENKWKEEVFYTYFASFNALEKEVWNTFFENTVKNLHEEELYEGYSAREKLLAFYYTFIEELKKNRSYVTYAVHPMKKPEITPSYMKRLKTSFITYANTVLNEGMATEEVLQRPYISKKYGDALWMQLLFIVDYWVKDESAAFEQTDVAIEKAVNLAFDLMGKSLLDSAVDFAKFLYQSRTN